jgi:LacI family transcriptional regulator
MTVSNVLNNRSGQVGVELRKRVLAACEKLGYRPHGGAQLLRSNRHMAIGVIIVDPSRYYLSDPFTAAVLAGLTDELRKHGYSVVLHGAAHDDIASLPLLQRIGSDGICLFPSGTPAMRRVLLDQAARLGQPVVLIQDDNLDSVGDVFAVTQDDLGGGAELARHLFARPSQQAVILLPELAWPAMERREAGVRTHLARLDQAPEFHVVRCGDESFDATQAAFAEHCKSHGEPDVVIGGNDRMAIAVLKWLMERHRRVPEDVRVTGFNGFDFWRYVTPELTTVRSPAFQLGEVAAQAMVHRLQHGSFSARSLTLPVEFVPQRSSLIDAGARAVPRSVKRNTAAARKIA